MMKKTFLKRLLNFFSLEDLSSLLVLLLLFSVASCTNNAGERISSLSHVDTFTCPMHPEIITNEPGNCPVCNMKLVKKENAAYEESEVDLTTLLQPTNSYVVSKIPVTTIRSASKQITIDALGRIDYDTRYANTISAKVSGRIEKLYVKYRFQHIHKGSPVMDIYSPELATAQQELLFLVKNDAENINLVNAAKQRLLLLGFTDAQLQQVIRSGKIKQTVTVYSSYTGHIHEAVSMEAGSTNAPVEMSTSSQTEELPIKEGMYVEKGQAVFRVYNTDNSWALLNLFGDDAALIKAGTPVALTPETAPGKAFEAKIDLVEPFYRSGSKTITARILFNNSQLQIPIGSQVKATMQVMSSMTNWLSRDAVLSLGLNKVVLVKQGGGFKVHPVTTGVTTDNEIQIISGLTMQDSVASNAQFLMDSESFIKTN